MSSVIADVAWLEGAGQLVWRQEPLAAPTGDQYLCRTIASVISPGTEIAAWKGLPPLRPGRVYPRVNGYCNVAEIIARGQDAGAYAVGQRVLSFSSHRSHFLCAEADLLLAVPDGVDPAAIAATYLYHLGYSAVLRAGVIAGSRVLVIGLGALGLTSVAMASVAGAEVQAISAQAIPARIAADFGASAVHPRDALDTVIAGWDGARADVVIATTGGWDDWRLALDAAARNGTIAVLGFPGRGEPAPDFNPLDSQYFYDKQLRIEAVGMIPAEAGAEGLPRFNQRANLAYIGGLIAAGRLQPEALISAHYPARDLAAAYDALVARSGSPITFALDWPA